MGQVDLQEPRGFGEMVRISWELYQNHVRVLLGLAALLVPVEFLQEFSSPASPILFAMLSVVLGILITGALIFAATEALDGRTPEFREAAQQARSRLGPLLTTRLLGGLLTVASLVAFPYFFVRWALAEQVVMLEGKRNWSALDVSSGLVRGHWWRVCAILLALNVITFFNTALVIGLPFAGADMRVALVGTDIIAAVVQPFTTVASVLLYYDLRARYPYMPDDPRNVLGPAPQT